MKKTTLLISLFLGLTSLNVMASNIENSKKEEILNTINTKEFKDIANNIKEQYKIIKNDVEKQKFRDSIGELTTNSVKDKLPLKVAPYTFVVDINYKNNIINYIAKIEDKNITEIFKEMKKEKVAEMTRTLKKQTSATICGSNMKLMVDLDLTIKYDYILSDKSQFTEILVSKKDCSS